MRTYHVLDDEANPRVGFYEDEFILEMPFLDLISEEDLQVSIEKIEINFLRKPEILAYFSELFGYIEEDVEETGDLSECYEIEDEEKFITYTIFPVPEEGTFELSITYAAKQSSFEYPLYTGSYDREKDGGRVLSEMLEDSHAFFHDALMQLAAANKELLNFPLYEVK